MLASRQFETHRPHRLHVQLQYYLESTSLHTHELYFGYYTLFTGVSEDTRIESYQLISLLSDIPKLPVEPPFALTVEVPLFFDVFGPNLRVDLTYAR